MLFSKVKNVVALGMIFLVLTAGVGAWRYAAVAGQAEKRREEPSLAGEKLSPPVEKRPKGEESKDKAKVPPIPAAKRCFRIDLSITRERKDGLRQTLGSPSQITSEGREACLSGIGDVYDVEAGGGRMEKIVIGPSIRATIRSGEGNKVRLDLTVSQPTRATFDQDVTVESRSLRILRWVELGQPITVKLRIEGKDWNGVSVRAAIQEAHKESDTNTIAAAEKALKVAEFYRRTGHPDAARLRYELISLRYPGTLYAERAEERLAELNKAEGKPPARVGQIFITGNTKMSDDVFLKALGLFPGQILSYPDLRIAEKRLSRLKGLKSNPKVNVIDREGDATFKDIQITVAESKTQRTNPSIASSPRLQGIFLVGTSGWSTRSRSRLGWHYRPPVVAW